MPDGAADRFSTMSTINPDERGRRIGIAVRPAVVVAAILVQFFAPVTLLLWALGLLTVPASGFLIAAYVAVWCVVGLAMLAVLNRRDPYLFAAVILTYVAGLFVVIRLVDPSSDLGLLSWLLIAIPYLIAGVLVVLSVLRRSAVRTTQERGVDTVATVVSAPVDGMVNYVQHQRLTLRFTDQQGVERYLRIGRTGGHYRVGDTLPLRYDPLQPSSKRAIIVGEKS